MRDRTIPETLGLPSPPSPIVTPPAPYQPPRQLTMPEAVDRLVFCRAYQLPTRIPSTQLHTQLPSNYPPNYLPTTHPTTFQLPTQLPTQLPSNYPPNYPPNYLPTTHPTTFQLPTQLPSNYPPNYPLFLKCLLPDRAWFPMGPLPKPPRFPTGPLPEPPRCPTCFFVTAHPFKFHSVREQVSASDADAARV